MGFDTARACEFKIPVSDTQAYRQFGNSVAVPAVKAVAQYMEDYLRKSVSRDLENSAVA